MKPTYAFCLGILALSIPFSAPGVSGEEAASAEEVFSSPESLARGLFEVKRLKTPADSPGQVGLDSFALMKKDDRWWVVSIINDIVTPERPLPEDLR